MKTFKKIEKIESGVVMSIQLPFIDNPISTYTCDFLEEYRGILLDALILRIENCLKHLNKNILNITYNNGSIIGYYDSDNKDHIFNIRSYNTMIEWYEKLKTLENHNEIPLNIIPQLIKGVGIISGSISKYDYEIVMTMLTEKLAK